MTYSGNDDSTIKRVQLWNENCSCGW